jgi:hypothetical protein
MMRSALSLKTEVTPLKTSRGLIPILILILIRRWATQREEMRGTTRICQMTWQTRTQIHWFMLFAMLLEAGMSHFLRGMDSAKKMYRW